MKATLWFNENACKRTPSLQSLRDGYDVGDPLVPSAHFRDIDAGEYVDGASFERACDDLYAAANADSRSNGRVERSMSIGDVVILDLYGDGRSEYAFACQSAGWRQLTCECEWADDVGDPEVGPDPYIVERDPRCPIHGRHRSAS